VRYLFIILASLSVIGCVSVQSSEKYLQPSVKNISNNLVLNADFETVWGNLIKNLSSQYFVINNISKESRLLNVSFTSDEPDKFIDCGSMYRSFKSSHYPDASGTKIYSVASNNVKFLTTVKAPPPPGGVIVLYESNPFYTLQVLKTTKLEGRTNIFVAPKGNKTEIRANTRYIFTNAARVRNLTLKIPVPSDSWSVSFNSNGTGTKNLLSTDGETIEVSCVSKGILEANILKAAD